jgi:hypothetical protein
MWATIFLRLICTDENESSITYTINVIRNEDQHINFPASAVEKTYGDADFTVAVNGYAPHGVQYTSETPDVATVADGGRIHIVKTGVARIKAVTPSVPGTHDIAEAAYTLTVRQKQLTIDASTSRVAAKVYDGTVTASMASVAFAGVGVNELAKDADYTVANVRYNSAEVFEATEVMATVALVPTNIPAQNDILADGAFRKSAVIGKAYLGEIDADFNLPVEVPARTSNCIIELGSLLPAVPSGRFGSVQYSVEQINDPGNVLAEITPAATILTLSVRDVLPGLSAEILVRVTSENYAGFIVVLTLLVGEGSTGVKGENIRENTQVGFRQQVLFVNTPFDEKISIYSLRGSLLFSSCKPAGQAKR